MTYGTLTSRLLNAVDHLPNPRAQRVRRAGQWEAVSSEEFLRRVAGLSSALVELGVKPGDRVGLFSTNRPEWHTADFAISGAGAIDRKSTRLNSSHGYISYAVLCFKNNLSPKLPTLDRKSTRLNSSHGYI